jgi:hypothetical protein
MPGRKGPTLETHADTLGNLYIHAGGASVLILREELPELLTAATRAYDSALLTLAGAHANPVIRAMLTESVVRGHDRESDPAAIGH